MAHSGVQLTDKQCDELREAFVIYDSDADKKVNKEQATCIIRSIGIAPTNEQFNKIFGHNETDINENADDPMIDAGEPKDDEGVSKTIKSENCCIYDDIFTYEDILNIVRTKCPGFESEDALRDAIRLFDRYGNNYVDAKEIRHILTNLGERLKDDEVDEITREMDISGDNQISCDEFVRTIRSVF